MLLGWGADAFTQAKENDKMTNAEFKHKIEWWVGNLEDKTTAEVEAVQKAVEVILRERDQANYKVMQRVNYGNT